ncbi:OsmC family protein [Fulvivirga lutea]|uniref:OsmC family protein n=1 Tax=Fulvivirga lutea TaxID=2810512 RepID=A0A974WGZ3_9BACT|nr:OsmC family protein [Fulvivirga lutea]QSE97890.1 OsmC family protein [Fulvivirga lutea]
MAQMKVSYLGSLRTEGTHIKSGNKIITDAPTDNNGKGEAYSPTDLLCSSLCSCMMTLMGIYANKESVSLEGLSADITKVMAANPRKVKEVIINFTIPELKASKEQIEGLKHAALTCPVSLSLSEELKQTISFNF